MIFNGFICLHLYLYRVTFVKAIHESDFCDGAEHEGFKLCFQVLLSRSHCFSFGTVNFGSCLLF